MDYKFGYLILLPKTINLGLKSSKFVTFLRLLWLELLSEFSANLRQINVVSRQKARILYLISSYFYIIRLDPSSRINCSFKLDKLKQPVEFIFLFLSYFVFEILCLPKNNLLNTLCRIDLAKYFIYHNRYSSVKLRHRINNLK